MNTYQDDSHLLIEHIHCNKCKQSIKDIKIEKYESQIAQAQDTTLITVYCHGELESWKVSTDAIQHRIEAIKKNCSVGSLKVFQEERKCFKLPVNNIGYNQLEFGEKQILIRNDAHKFYLILDNINLKLIHDRECIREENAIQQIKHQFQPPDNNIINVLRAQEDCELFKLPRNCLDFRAILLFKQSEVNGDWDRIDAISLLHGKSNYWLTLNQYSVNIVNSSRHNLFEVTDIPINKLRY